MNKERFEQVRSKIDAYVREAVTREMKRQAKSFSEDVLRPLVEDFLSRSLEKYLSQHLESALEASLRAMEEIFDQPEDAYEVPLEEPEPDVFGREGAPEVPSDEVLADRMLAYVQLYQTSNNTERVPKSKTLSKTLNIGSLDIIRIYSLLCDSGRTTALNRQGRHPTIRILIPLKDPIRYLTPNQIP